LILIALFGHLSRDGMMDFLMGLASSYSQFQQLPTRHYVNQTYSLYANDNWHMTKNLSLQLGFRFGALPHAWERSNAVANFNPGAYSATAAPIWDCSAGGTAVTPCAGDASNGTLDPNGPGFAQINNTRGFVGSILGGWQIAGVATAESGTIIANQGPGLAINYDPIGLGGGYTNRPNVTCRPGYLKIADAMVRYVSVLSSGARVGRRRQQWLRQRSEGHRPRSGTVQLRYLAL